MDDLIRFYTDRYDEDSRLLRHPVEFAVTTFILDSLSETRSRILDVGAGTGTYAIHYARKGHSVVALDIVPAHIAALKSKLQALSRLDVSAELGDAAELSRFQDGSFDAVLCLGPLYHLADPHPCISECLRVLKADGLLAAAYVNRAAPPSRHEQDTELFFKHAPAGIDSLFRGHCLDWLFNVPADGEPFAALDEALKVKPDSLEVAHTWLRDHPQSLRALDKLFIHGLYAGRKA